MFFHLLEGTDFFWAALLLGLWAWTAVLVFDRLRTAHAERKRVVDTRECYATVARVWQHPTREMQRAREFTERHAPDALAALDGEPITPLGDRRAAFFDDQLSLVATIGPLVGLAGTVAGYQGTFQDLVASGSAGGLSAVAGPVALAMKTTLGGLVPAISAPIARALLRVDPSRRAENLELRKLLARMRRSEAAMLAEPCDPASAEAAEPDDVEAA